MKHKSFAVHENTWILYGFVTFVIVLTGVCWGSAAAAAQVLVAAVAVVVANPDDVVVAVVLVRVSLFAD